MKPRAQETRTGTPAMKLLIISNTSWSVLNFRSGLIRALQEAGYSVVAVAPRDQYSDALPGLGCEYEPLEFHNKGTNPFRDLLTIARVTRLLRRHQPLCALTFTPKPNIYTAIAAKTIGVPVIPNIAGLGTAYVRGGWLMKLVEGLYRFAMSSAERVFFQNPEDHELFVKRGLVERSRSIRLPGSGVDTRRFQPQPRPDSSSASFSFLLFGRLLGDKGVREYVEAARNLRTRHPQVRFRLLGFLDAANPSAISYAEVRSWVDRGDIEYSEPTTDVTPHLASADCVVLPSYYREGTPRSLLEAASMGKPVITTDAPGCRDVVDDGITGFLVKPRDAADLADKMERMLLLGTEARAVMGAKARMKMLREFDERIVLDHYLSAVAACRKCNDQTSYSGGTNEL